MYVVSGVITALKLSSVNGCGHMMLMPWFGSPLTAAKITHSSGITKAAAMTSKIKLASSRPDSRSRPRGLMCVTGEAAVLAWAGVGHWLAVTLPFTVLLFGTALIVPNATAAAITPFPGSAGAASSVIGALGFTVGAIMSTVLGAAFDGSARPMASAAALAGIGAFLFERLLLRGKA